MIGYLLNVSHSCSINKSRKSFVDKIWEVESAVPGGEGPRKAGETRSG